MSWGYPSVVGPVSEWLDAVPVEGCWPGATIVVRTDDAAATVVATGVSGGGSDLVPLVPGTRLSAGQMLVAQQTVAGDASGWTPSALAVRVGAAPTAHSQLPPLSFTSRLFACGRAVWLSGAAPGAAVTVSDAATVLATGRAGATGDARLAVAPSMPGAGTSISARQDAPAGFPPLTGVANIASAPTLAVPLGPLPPPTLPAPLPMGCESAVLVGGVVDGADVRVERASDNLAATAVFDLSQLWFQLPAAFPAAGDRIEVTQALPACEREPSPPAYADIPPAQAPDPAVITQPCAGSSSLHLDGLRPGATLTIAVDGFNPLQYQVPASHTSWDAPTDPLPEGKTVTVTVEVCTFSAQSQTTVVGSAPVPAPTFADDLVACARVVSVSTKAGAALEIWADYGSGPTQISQRVTAKSDLATIHVFPYLSVPEKVWARQLACAGGWTQSEPPADVGLRPRLVPLELSPPVEGQQHVLPLNVVPGAHVAVYATSPGSTTPVLLGERDVTRADPAVGLIRRLTTEDTVWAIQSMCSDVQEGSQNYRVMPGVMHFPLPAPLVYDSGMTPGGNVTVHSADLACRFADGFWYIEADVENAEPSYDCELVVGATLTLTSPLVFGGSVDVDVAAAGKLPGGLASLGYPSRWRAYKTGTDSQLLNLGFWLEVIKASATWTAVPAWDNYGTGPDKPEWKANQALPDPFQIFPPMPPDGDFPSA